MLKLIISLITIYCIITICIYFIQRRLIYFPSQELMSPENLGLPDMQTITLRTEDGLILTSWYHSAKLNAPTLLFFHGNGGNIASRNSLVLPYIDAGFGVLLLEYRGYGGNPGKPTEYGLYRDAKAGYDYLITQGIDPSCIILYGESLGSAVAVNLGRHEKAGAVVLQAPFTSLLDVAKIHYFYFPVSWLLKDKYESIKKIKDINVPIFIVHGTSDKIVPFKLGKKLYHQANEPKELFSFQGGTHNGLNPDSITEIIIQALKNYTICALGKIDEKQS